MIDTTNPHFLNDEALHKTAQTYINIFEKEINELLHFEQEKKN